jgi:hypothetical protein
VLIWYGNCTKESQFAFSSSLTPQATEQESTKETNWLTESIVTRYPCESLVTLTDEITSSLLSPVPVKALKMILALPSRYMTQGDSVQRISVVSINALMKTDSERLVIEAKAVSTI